MLTREENEFLTRVGPEAPMGQLFRRYWLPALFSEEIATPNCTPVRVKLLGEELLAFRDSDGKVAMVDEYCPHRRASLFFGRNEECGIRCVYHGWKFDVEGNCTDMPSEPKNSPFKDKVKLTSYPCKEHGGIVWTYMGPKDLMPEFPEYDWMRTPPSHIYIGKAFQENNFVTALEGTFDSAHINFLHVGALFLTENSRSINDLLDVSNPEIIPIETDYGLAVGALREKNSETSYCRISQFFLPAHSQVPEVIDDDARAAFFFVPQDDENTTIFTMTWNARRPLTNEEISNCKNGASIHNALIPGTFLPKANKSNHYLINRELQASGVSFTGISGIAAADLAVQESSGKILDRTKEHLGTSDIAIIAVRRRLMNAAKSVLKGETPFGLQPRSHHVHPVGTELKKGEKFEELVKQYV